MNPEERSLVTDLFDRLAELEDTERDPEAERAISDGLRRAPNAVYALVQTALVQDEALKRADARIRDLEVQLGKEPQRPRSESFLSSMREALTGRRVSAPTDRPGDAPMVARADYRSPPSPMSAESGLGSPGGSFLGTAAATAAGMIGGSLMLDSIRGMMGHRPGIGGFGPTSGVAGGPGTPWASAPASGGNIAREAGHENTRSGDDDPGSSHGDHKVDDGDYHDDGDYQDNGDFDDGSGDFEDSGGDFGGDDDEA